MGQTRATSSGLAGRELKRYAVAIAVSGVALALTVAFRNRLAPTPFLLLYLAVTASAWYGGPWPGVLAAVVSVLGVEFVASQQHLAATDPALYLRLAVFFGVAMLTSGMSGSLNGAKRRAEARASEAVAASNRLRQVAGITADLVLHQTLDDLLHGLLGRVEKALDVDEVTILLLDGDGLHLTVRASLPSEQPAEGGFRVPVGRGFAGRVAATQASSIINDTTTIELLNPYLRATTRSLLGVPLLSDTGLVGVLHVGTKLRRNFTADDQAFLELLATRAALAIDAARVRESERAALAAAELARTDAERANRVKGDFLAHMSHELRTPLNAIAGYVELLEMGIRGPVTREQIEDLGRIRRSQQHLLSLINEVLEYAKIEAGHLDFELSDVDVDVLVSRVAELVEPQARLTGIELSCISRESHLLARADEGRAEQILINLLSNAVKFTGAAGRVSVEAEVVSRGGADDAVAIHVRDTGIGIAAEQTEAVFEPFVQVDQTLSRRAGGTGLGLAISRELARAMGGDLIVESDLGFGSRFTLILPRQAFAGRGLLPARNAAARVP